MINIANTTSGYRNHEAKKHLLEARRLMELESLAAPSADGKESARETMQSIDEVLNSIDQSILALL